MSAPATETTGPAPSKQDRLVERNRRYLVSPKKFRHEVVRDVLNDVTKLVSLAISLGTVQGASGSGKSHETDLKAVKTYYNHYLVRVLGRVRDLANYQERAYRLAGKRVAHALQSETGRARARKPTMFSAVNVYAPEITAFITEACGTNDALKPVLENGAFKDGKLKGLLSPTFTTQFMLAYLAIHRRFNKENGQYIQPDELIKKHLGSGVNAVLDKIRAEKPENAAKFPGQFTFCRLQSLIAHYARPPAPGSAEETRVKALRTDDSVKGQLKSEFEHITTVRKQAYDRVHADKPAKPASAPRVKTPGAKKESDQLAFSRALKAAVTKSSKTTAGSAAADAMERGALRSVRRVAAPVAAA